MAKEGLVTYVDNDLVRRIREGDVTAFEELFARHQRRVYNICLQILNNEAEAADVTQDVFVKAYKSIKSLKSDAAFVGWLKTLAVNMCRDALRKRVRTASVQSLDKLIETGDGDCLQREIEDWSHNPERSMDKRETCKIVQKAISSLSLDYREVVVLFYVDGAEVNEIAKTLNSPVGTIKSRLARARAELKRKLAHLVET
ncbi:MAG: sigma-70 family RNA polymerase sigma factor [Armatimonadota bacterium]|nr:sigma-70 family RNA polymerase sigma factor [bacterium]